MINGFIYGFYTHDEAENIAKIFQSKDRTPIFNKLLKDVNNTNITSENYSSWTTEIKELNENIDTDIYRTDLDNNNYFDIINLFFYMHFQYF